MSLNLLEMDLNANFISRQLEFVYCRCLNCYYVNVQRPAYGVLGHMPIHFRDGRVVLEDDRGLICVLRIMLIVKTNKHILLQLKLI
jgi:hypothetical protein